MFDYPTIKFIWWVLVGVLLIGFAIMDGHDMGVGALLPFVGRSDDERRVLLNTVGPHWEGNQVWFITGGGALFAAWPYVCATAFSGFYWAMLALLWALFFRPVGFDYRSKLADPRWRAFWDGGLFVGGAVPPLIFGVAFGNLLLGVPFNFDDTLRGSYHGSFWGLLSPFALLCGVLASAMITFQGATFLALCTVGVVDRADGGAVVRRRRGVGGPARWLRDRGRGRSGGVVQSAGQAGEQRAGCLAGQVRALAAAVAVAGARGALGAGRGGAGARRAGQMTLPDDYQSQLQPVLVANWK